MKTRKMIIKDTVTNTLLICNNDVICNNDLVCGFISFRTKGSIAWFGSYGIDDEGKMIKAYNEKEYNKNAKANRQSTININYDEDIDAITSSLNQKLRVIKGELWNHVNYGLPLFDKVKNKSIVDAVVIKEVLETKGVTNINEMISQKENTEYQLAIKINTIFGESNLVK